jgi:hypothetical protein
MRSTSPPLDEATFEENIPAAAKAPNVIKPIVNENKVPFVTDAGDRLPHAHNSLESFQHAVALVPELRSIACR